jgi:hypothetical protein
MAAQDLPSARPADLLSPTDLHWEQLVSTAEPGELFEEVEPPRGEFMWEKWAIAAIVILALINGLLHLIRLA